MKFINNYLPIILLSTMLNQSCTTPKEQQNTSKLSQEEISTWFEQKQWLGQSSLEPHPSIDQEAFATYYFSNQKLWEKAFDYLNNTDLQKLEVGVHEIQGRELFVIVSSYSTKSPQDVFFENHDKFTDLQYVVSGQEYIGLTNLSNAKIRTPYENERDITFYDVTSSSNLLAHPGTFFIFFPHNVHCPSLIIDQSDNVKKIVIKVKNS
ncbi:YhcH/YjgK/YiaL family protein [Algoriphagus sp.]|uniref:YhcH/YjgK/YiaL family protein n=1 Tax=Algoriphagus sp. TaxID=1872435 RepID=UPI003F71BDF7